MYRCTIPSTRSLSFIVAALLLAAPPAGRVLAQSTGTTASGLTSTQGESAGSTVGPLSNDGEMTHAIPIEVPPARGGKVTPRLALTYRGSAPNGVLGVGWTLPSTYIEEDDLGRVPVSSSDVDADGRFFETRYVFRAGAGGCRMVETPSGGFRCETQGSVYLLFQERSDADGPYWEAFDGGGTLYRFALAELGPDGSPFRWYLTDLVDTNGNWTRYSYREITPGGSCVGNTFTWQPVMLDSVAWNNVARPVLSQRLPGRSPCAKADFKDQLLFVYETRPDPIWKVQTNGRFLIEERVRELRVSSRDETSTLHRWRTYHLRYDRSPTNGRSRLTEVRVTGFGCTASIDASGEIACAAEAILPATTMEYSTGPEAFEGASTLVSSADLPGHMGEDHGSGVLSTYSTLIDLDGDGRSDFFEQWALDQRRSLDEAAYDRTSAMRWIRNEGGSPGRAPGDALPREEPWAGPTEDVDSDRLVDMNGDGNVDLVVDAARGWRVFYGDGRSFSRTGQSWDTSGAANWLASNEVSLPDENDRRDLQDQLDRCGVGLTCVWRRELNKHYYSYNTVQYTVDLTGDGIVDYVVYAGQREGMDRWWIFSGYVSGPRSGGFTEVPMEWTLERRGNLPRYQTPSVVVQSVATGVDGTTNFAALLVDLNGDGLLDYHIRDSTGTGASRLRLNTGRGFVPTPWDWPAAVERPWPFTRITGAMHDQKRGFADFNGDGLPDWAEVVGCRDCRVVTYYLEVYYNTGSGFREDSKTWSNRFIALRRTAAGRQLQGLVDLDGDGLLDHVVDTQPGKWTVHMATADSEGNATIIPDRLVGVDNGIGAGARISYQPSSSIESARSGLRYVVSRITSYESLQGSLIVPARFSYDGGVSHYNPGSHAWEFRGYDRVTQSRNGAETIEKVYEVSDPYTAGRIRETRLYDANGCPVSRESVEWSTFVVTQGMGYPDVTIPYPAVVETREWSYPQGTSCASGQAVPTGTIVRQSGIDEIDEYGNPKRTFDRGQIDNGGDDICTVTEYASSPGSRVVNAPHRVTVHELNGTTPAAVLKESVFQYDGPVDSENGALGGGEVDAGNLKWVTHDVYDLGDLTLPPRTLLVEKRGYDEWGNVVVHVSMLDGANGNRTTISYDSTYELFVEAEHTGENVTGGSLPNAPLSSFRSWDFGRGTVLSETDPNGVSRIFTVDPFGRVKRTEVDLSTGTLVESETAYRYRPDSTVTRVRTWHDSNQYVDTEEVRDGLGRIVEQSRDLGADLGGARHVTSMRYDALGRLQFTLHPGTGPIEARFYDARGRLETRVVAPQTSLPTAATQTNVEQSTFVTRYRYAIVSAWRGQKGFSVETTLPFDPRHPHRPGAAAPVRREIKDVHGRRVLVVDPEGTEVSYEYDRLGNLELSGRLLETPAGQQLPIITRVRSDSLGRKLLIDDPDKGVTRYSFDAAGNVLVKEQSDPLSPGAFESRVVYTYDILGRPLTKRSESNQLGVWVADSSVEVDFFYDGIASLPGGLRDLHPEPTNLAGRLVATTEGAASSPDGATFFGYDELGRTAVEGRYVPGAGTYFVRREYSLDGRVERVGYARGAMPGTPADRSGVPFEDHGQIQYWYNSAGWLTHVTDAVNPAKTYYEARTFDNLGDPVEVSRANGLIVEFWQRHPVDRRLEELSVRRRGGGSAYPVGSLPLVHLAYDRYDASGNLLELTDRITAAPYEYDYDGRFQLIAARAGEGTNVPCPEGERCVRAHDSISFGQSYDLSFVYDNLGNLRWMTDHRDPVKSREFEYRDGGLHPQAMLRMHTQNIFLDYAHERGNLTSESFAGLIGTMYDYTAEDLLSSVRKGSTRRVDYAYDAAQRRVRQTVSERGVITKDIAYVGKWMEVDLTASPPVVSVHLYGAGRRLSTLRGAASSPTPSSERHYVHDHLGSVRSVVDGNGTILSYTSYLPFGEIDARTSSDPGSFGFTGQQNDADSALLYYGARYYDPKLGRFLTADTVVPDPSRPLAFNRYTYAYNNPVNLVDLDGHEPSTAVALIGLAVAIAVGTTAGAVHASNTGGDVVAEAFKGGLKAFIIWGYSFAAGEVASLIAAPVASAATAGTTAASATSAASLAESAARGVALATTNYLAGAGLNGRSVDPVELLVVGHLGGLASGKQLSSFLGVARRGVYLIDAASAVARIGARAGLAARRSSGSAGTAVAVSLAGGAVSEVLRFAVSAGAHSISNRWAKATAGELGAELRSLAAATARGMVIGAFPTGCVGDVCSPHTSFGEDVRDGVLRYYLGLDVSQHDQGHIDPVQN